MISGAGYFQSRLLPAMIVGTVFMAPGLADDNTGAEKNMEPPDEAVPKREYIRMEPRLGTLEPPTHQEEQLEIFPPVRPRVPGQQVRLKGGVIEANLAIEWDDWHNDFGRAVASRMFSNVGEFLNMPQGLTTWYHFEVTADRHVKHAEITKSSGNLWFDHAVLQAVYKLEGNSLLAFPPGSQRSEISADIGVRMGGEKTGYLRFGDVEYHEVSPASSATEASNAPGKSKSTTRKKHHETAADNNF